MDLNELMGQLQSDLTRMVKESYNAPQTAMEHWAAFRAAIDWAEPDSRLNGDPCGIVCSFCCFETAWTSPNSAVLLDLRAGGLQ